MSQTLVADKAIGVSPKEPLLATKLYTPPLHSTLVPRPHLLKRLTQGLENRLILISGPAGSGKTTLSEWLAS